MGNTFKVFEDQIRCVLEKVPKVAFTIDGWTSPYQDSFLAITAHWIDDDWKHKDITIGFEPLTGSHTGEALMQSFVDTIRRFDLQRKVLSITSDNGSNVVKMMKQLAEFTRQNRDEW